MLTRSIALAVMLGFGTATASAGAPELQAEWSAKKLAPAYPDGPWKLTWTEMTYNSLDKKIVLWGGGGLYGYRNDMWSYDPAADDWTLLFPYSSCPGNTGFSSPNGSDDVAVKYDPVNHLIWTFMNPAGYHCLSKVPMRTAEGGTDTQNIYDSTLAGDSADDYAHWQVLVNKRTYATVTAYDPALKRLTLDRPVSGLAAGTPYQLLATIGRGAWYYNLANGEWRSLVQPYFGYTGPQPENPRYAPGVDFSPVEKAFAMFGGRDLERNVWKLDVLTKTWSKLPVPATAPPARRQIANSMVYDAANDVFILFGGMCTDFSYNCPYGKPMGDTWAYKLSTNTWTRMDPPAGPAARMQHHMAYDAEHGVVVMFGGRGGPTNSDLYDDLWVYHYPTNTWTQLTATGGPSARYLGMIAYHPVAKETIIFGGATVLYGGDSQEVWSLKLTNTAAGNSPPVAIAQVTPATGTPGTVFNFDGSASNDPDGAIVTYAWDFGDGTGATGPLASHAYAATGDYVARLTVTDTGGLSREATLLVPVTAASPPAPVLGITSVTISGTVSDAAITQVLVNGVPVPVVGGHFTAPVTVSPDTTEATIEATGAGGSDTRTVVITVQ